MRIDSLLGGCWWERLLPPLVLQCSKARSDGATNSRAVYDLQRVPLHRLRIDASTDSLGILSFSDSGSQPAAQIQVSRDGGTWSSGSRTPGAMLFMTAPDSASSATERMRITIVLEMSALGKTQRLATVKIYKFIQLAQTERQYI